MDGRKCGTSNAGCNGDFQNSANYSTGVTHVFIFSDMSAENVKTAHLRYEVILQVNRFVLVTNSLTETSPDALDPQPPTRTTPLSLKSSKHDRTATWRN